MIFGLFTEVGDYRTALLYAGCLFLPAALIALRLPEPPEHEVVSEPMSQDVVALAD